MDQEYFKNLYDTREFADCSFVFPNEEGKIIKGHVAVLAYATPVFRSMFLSLEEESNEGYMVDVKDVKSHVFEALLRFIYCRDRIKTTIADLVNLYDAFDKYDCKDGKAFIIQQILKSEILSLGCVKLLQLAKIINDDLLFKVCAETLFKQNQYDLEIINIPPELLNEALCFLNNNEGNDQVCSQTILSIVMKYISVNQSRLSNLKETLLPTLESLNWGTVPLKEIAKCPILNNRQKVSFLISHLEANGLESENESNDMLRPLLNVEKKSVDTKHKLSCEERLVSEVVTSISRLYIEEKRTDCEFMFPDGKILKAHKFVLCISSPVFEAMFYGTVGQANPVEIIDTEKSTFELLLKILYLLDADLSSQSSETLAHLYAVAHKYQCMTALDLIRENISVRSEGAFLFFHLSKTYDDKKLMKTFLKHLENPLAALKTDHFLKSDPETVCLVYKGNKVDGSGMIGLVKGLEFYIEKNKEGRSQIIFEVQKALKGIRFMDLSTLEILKTALLSDRDKLIFFAIKKDCKMLIGPPTLLEIERLSAFDCYHVKMNMDSDFSTWQMT